MSKHKIENDNDIEILKNKILISLGELKQVDENTKADGNFLFKSQRTNAGRKLPPYYLIYFLFVDLLGFKNLGRFEKVAWSIPIDYKGRAFLIEHRKFGIGIFAHNAVVEEKDAEEILKIINKAVKLARPYFKYIANSSVAGSRINILNKSQKLYGRYNYFLKEYQKTKKNIDKHLPPKISLKENVKIINYSSIYKNKQKAEYLLSAAIESFFSWSEHVFVLLAVMYGYLKTGKEIVEFINCDWDVKYKKVMPLSNKMNKSYYEKLLIIKRQLRNYLTHGAFGKNGEAFYFHSGAGAVPVFLDDNENLALAIERQQFNFIESKVLNLIQEFIEHLWSGDREAAKMYICDTDFKLVLTYCNDGTYSKALSSLDKMKEFIDYTCYRVDGAANMDW